jgi:hypothetical protein
MEGQSLIGTGQNDTSIKASSGAFFVGENRTSDSPALV